MPRLPKVTFPKTVKFVTTRFEQGILLPANPLMEFIFYCAVARAQALHPVRICHFVVEGSHPHFIMAINNPDDLKDFMGHFKTESAHYINKLLGRRKRTIWCEGYDSPTLVDEEKAIEKIVYTYSNPAKDCQEDSIDKYPGANSWKMFQSGKLEKTFPWIHRPTVWKIPTGPLALNKYENCVRLLKKRATEQHTLKLEPNAWMECFGITDEQEQKKRNEKIKRRLREEERKYREIRKKEGKTVIGAAKLRRQNLDLSYTPEKAGKKMWCLSSDVALRKAFISYAKSLVVQAKEVQKRWAVGDFSVPYPLGLYPPSMPKLAEPLGYQRFL